MAYSDQYKQWTYTGGAFAYGLNVSWMALTMSTRTNQSEYSNLFMPDGTPRWWGSEPAPQPIGTMTGEEYWHLPIMSTGDAMGRHTESWKEWLLHPAYDDYWKAVSIEDKYPRYRGAGLYC